jgi:hypothetical protein
MAANTANAIKAYLESLGLGVSVYRDAAPKNTGLPYILVHEGISVVPEPTFNSHDDTEGHVRELAQVDVWQIWKNLRTDTIEESYTLPDAITRALNGARLADAPTHVAGVRVIGVVRTIGNPDPKARDGAVGADDKVRHAITVEVRRTLTALA